MKLRRPLAVAVVLPLLACAPPPGAEWRAAHPGAPRRSPEQGAPLGEVLAALTESEPGARRVRVGHLDLLGLESDPWQPIESEAALAADAHGSAHHAVIALRSCRHRSGLRRHEVTRGSWLLFRGGRLAAFDHWEFADDCEPEHRFLPAASTELELEADLARFVARRFPENALGPRETFQKGLVYLEHDRVDEATAMLALGDRALAELSREPEEDEGADEAALADARVVRAELSVALRKKRGLDQDPADRFWEGY